MGTEEPNNGLSLKESHCLNGMQTHWTGGKWFGRKGGSIFRLLYFVSVRCESQSLAWESAWWVETTGGKEGTSMTALPEKGALPTAGQGWGSAQICQIQREASCPGSVSEVSSSTISLLCQWWKQETQQRWRCWCPSGIYDLPHAILFSFFFTKCC